MSVPVCRAGIFASTSVVLAIGALCATPLAQAKVGPGRSAMVTANLKF